MNREQIDNVIMPVHKSVICLHLQCFAHFPGYSVSARSGKGTGKGRVADKRFGYQLSKKQGGAPGLLGKRWCRAGATRRR